MIDWVSVALNACWIVGLAMLLAAFGYHDWLAHETARPLSDVLGLHSWRLYSIAGLLLTAVGFGYGLASRWWEQAICAGGAMVFGWQLVTLAREGRGKADR